MQQFSTVGIIGLGAFGQFVAGLVPPDTATVLGYDPAAPAVVPGVTIASLEAVARADVLILAVPLQAYPSLLPKLATLVPPQTLVVDICSVKVYPQRYLAQYMPDHPNILQTHPLFGPQSAAKSTKGHVLVVTAEQGERAVQLVAWCAETLGLAVHHMSSEEHDQIMARIHVLTFFVARGLSAMRNLDVPFTTPSYHMIQDLVTFDRTHSEELFQTIQQGNPFAGEIRQGLLDSFSSLAAALDADTVPQDVGTTRQKERR